MQESTESGVKLFSPSLPKGGGASVGMGNVNVAPGSDGTLHFSLPLPTSSGRYLTPSLTLSYSSGNGNGIFGLGWQTSVMGISRRTDKGTPAYTSDDEFVGPDGEVLVPETDTQGNKITRQADILQGISLGGAYTVTRYYPRVESGFDLIESWENAEDSQFWTVHTSDGLLHCFGKTIQAHITALDNPSRIAEWLLEETVSPFGEHICYRYQTENSVNIQQEQDSHQYGANRYPAEILYGNKEPYTQLYLLSSGIPADDQWLFFTVFDYGERDGTPPAYARENEWPARSDSFSRYEYGFEIRTCRLCRQILLFHNFPELGSSPYLVSQLLLEYDENPIASLLTAVWQRAYEKVGKMLSLPPLEFDYTRFQVNEVNKTDWQPFLPSPGLDDQYYQMVDLYGEGIPGLLYQNSGCWYYRAPVRDETSTSPDGITYTNWTALPQIPVPSENGMLLDMDGDGYLEWLVAAPGTVGRYRINPDETLSRFIPLQALPTEFFNPYSQLSNVTGSSYVDLLMVGPKSVRFYAGQEDGFERARDVWQKEGVTLPSIDLNARDMVVFSDVLGSGQQHLTRIRHDGVTCWPNLGNGIFGEPIFLPGFSIPEADFSPKQVYLADLDGSGAADIIYVTHDALLYYQNLSGNAFAAPSSLSLPEGVHFDDLCNLIPADVQGLGVSTLLFDAPYINPRHWRLDLLQSKPYLLNRINNNLGADQSFSYRSSAQYWLDEKEQGPKAACALPFPIQLLSKVSITDEITGNQTVQQCTYRTGVYDRAQREFRGFGYMELRQEAQDRQGMILDAVAPQTVRNWYHTGREEDESNAAALYWQGDPEAYALGDTRFTSFDTQADQDVLLAASDEQQRYWLYRSLKGMPLRAETFAGSAMETALYQTASFRYQVRLLHDFERTCVVLPLQLEQQSYNYECIISDPQCSQSIQQNFDTYGFSRQGVTIQYPRRNKPAENPYPDTLPETSWGSSYDSQQAVLRFSVQQQTFYHLTGNETWKLGMPKQNRMDVYAYPADLVPGRGVRAEDLNEKGILSSTPSEHAYGGQTEIVYVGETGPDLRSLVHYTRSASLDEVSLQAYDGILSAEELTGRLEAAGYIRTKRILGDGGEEDIWAVEQGFTQYADENGFFRPLTQRTTMLTGEQLLSWDPYYCEIVSAEDALGNRVQVEYDYRFLRPVHITDVNDNISQVKLDALGRVVYNCYWGTEQGSEVGFPDDKDFQAPDSVETALGLTAPLSVASCVVYCPDSWMGSITREQLAAQDADSGELWDELVAQRFITPEGQIRTRGRDELSVKVAMNAAAADVLLKATRLPSHTAMLQADRYPDDPKQQIQKGVTFGDGFGQTIQVTQKVESGSTYQFLDDGNIQEDGAGNPAEAVSESRWAVSGCVEYAGAGIVLQDFLPFFLNDWRYVNIGGAKALLYANSHYYDPLGREIRTVNPKGYERRNQFYPWFTVGEDENDTMEASD